MRTAEMIVKEYLGQGYSLESLRVLADSRAEPIRTEMLALLADAEDAEVAEVACETEGLDDAPQVFFVAEDDESASDEEFGIDFNLMAEGEADSPAAAEESVAEVLGELAAAVALPEAAPATVPALPETAALAMSSESGDYLPGVPSPADADGMPALGGEAVTGRKSVMDTVPATLSEGAPVPLADADEGGESRQERRRRDRARKKKEKRDKKTGVPAGETLPEIVLARSEGTDTMVPEKSECVPILAAAALAPDTDAAPVPVEPMEPVERAAVRTMITPIDLIEPPEDSADTESRAEPPPVAAPMPEPAPAEAEAVETGIGNDYGMIVSGGGDALRMDAYNLLAGDEADAGGEEIEPVPAGEDNANVILFRTPFSGTEEEDAGEEEAYSPPVLRMLPAAEEAEDAAGTAVDAAGGTDAPVPESVMPEGGEALSSADCLSLLRAFVGGPGEDDAAEDAAAGDEHVIVAMELGAAPVDPDELIARERAVLEAEYQERLDEFARRLAEVRAENAQSEDRIREKEEALREKEAEAAGLRSRNARDEEHLKTLGDQLEAVRSELADRDARLLRLSGMREEHEKLYAEFEDLRAAYNEVVTEVMPGLQEERDDLALTLERQCDEEDKLRTSLSGARKRLAVGYSMGAAACLMLVSFPAANWLRSDQDAREFAMDRQQAAELRERAETAESETLQAGQTIVELERKLNLAALELAKLETRNGELSRRGRDLAAAGAAAPQHPGGGAPTRTSTMALQGTPGSGGQLRVNEVRDPAGSIEQAYADNRNRRTDEAPQMAAAAAGGGRIQVSAVARNRQPGTGSGLSLRPPADNAAGRERASAETRAKVRAGEGVAQVVYRVLGTRDPEVINWVIRENDIKKDRRGNPRIYPEQELRLPERLEQAASAAKR